MKLWQVVLLVAGVSGAAFVAGALGALAAIEGERRPRAAAPALKIVPGDSPGAA